MSSDISTMPISARPGVAEHGATRCFHCGEINPPGTRSRAQIDGEDVSGGAAQGAAVMLAFGLGTLPNLLAGGVLLSRARRIMSAEMARRTAAFIMVAFGLAGMVRAFLVSGLLMTPFCLT